MGMGVYTNYSEEKVNKYENIGNNDNFNVKDRAKEFYLSRGFPNHGKSLREVLNESIYSDYDITKIRNKSYSPVKQKKTKSTELELEKEPKKKSTELNNIIKANKNNLDNKKLNDKEKNLQPNNSNNQNLILNNNSKLVESNINNKNININININIDMPKDKNNETIIKASKDASEISFKKINKDYPEEKILIKLDSDAEKNNNIIIHHSSDNFNNTSNKKIKNKKQNNPLKTTNNENTPEKTEKKTDESEVKIVFIDEEKDENKTNKSNNSSVKFNSKNSSNTEIKRIKMITSSLMKDIRKDYKFCETLGGGHFGTVRKAHRRNEKKPYQYYAIKSISNRNLTKKDYEDLVKEVDIISGLDHPNIIKFYETYHDEYYFHIVMELCKGKEVFEKIANQGNISEKKVVNIIFKVLLAIAHCHSRGITHRDLKPENILFDSLKMDSEIKIIDFGLSRKYSQDEKMHTILGTPYYVAPEVLKGEYDEKCDIWSIGAMTYLILCGEPPFTGVSNNEIFKKIVRDDLKFNPYKWKNISSNAKDFVRICLNKNANLRPSASKAVEHKWFSSVIKETHSIKKLSKESLINFKNFNIRNTFKQTIMKYLLNTLNEEEICIYKNTFFAADYYNNGLVEKGEIKKAFNLSNLEITDEEIDNLFDVIDGSRQKGGIGYTEFLMASIDQKVLFTKDKLEKAFNYFDLNNSQYIEFEDLKEAFLRMGRECINSDDIKAIISDALMCIKNENDVQIDKSNEDKKDKISKDDFFKIFQI